VLRSPGCAWSAAARRFVCTRTGLSVKGADAVYPPANSSTVGGPNEMVNLLCERRLVEVLPDKHAKQGLRGGHALREGFSRSMLRNRRISWMLCSRGVVSLGNQPPRRLVPRREGLGRCYRPEGAFALLTSAIT
jgi:hypothetical protein